MANMANNHQDNFMLSALKVDCSGARENFFCADVLPYNTMATMPTSRLDQSTAPKSKQIQWFGGQFE